MSQRDAVADACFVSRMFRDKTPAPGRAVERGVDEREELFGDGVEYHISEPPEAWDDLGDDIKLDDQGDPYYDIG